VKRLSRAVDDYISSAPKSTQPRLAELRKAILDVAPDAKEGISYKIPFYSYKGRLAWFGYFPSHIGLYIRPPVVAQFGKELAGYRTTKSAVHLPLNQRVPVRLVQRLIRARMRLNEADEAASRQDRRA
jgi:uncharacterized protein YdhG (YjbR/CyaY superfamily)